MISARRSIVVGQNPGKMFLYSSADFAKTAATVAYLENGSTKNEHPLPRNGRFQKNNPLIGG